MSEMIKDQETSNEQGNAGRRRLVRGAVAFAPLLLTLRSGAAAASCIGVKIAQTTPNSGNGKISAAGVVVGDLCVAPNVLTECPAPQSGKVLPSSPVSQANTERVVQNGNFITCGNDAQFKGDNIAILSSASVASFGVAGL